MGSIGNDCNGVTAGWANEPIAIIGMSAKFSGDATNTEKFWRMLVEGRSGWTPFPSSRFNAKGVYHPNNERLNSTHVTGAHFLEEDVGLFDAAFFGYSSETAASLDPQYRLQLESVYEALENAGLPLAQIAGSNTSVFTGVFVHDYRDSLLRDADNLPRLMATGTGVPMMSNRISHFFDFRGASMTIETACSSSMVAMHQAIQSLRTGEADMSIVGGANLTLNPDMFKALGSAGFLSADGKSYAFDSRASGYGRGEGVGTLVIKRLKDALASGDPIRAVIRESFLNQDGKTETITTPSLEAQEALIWACYRKAGLDPRDTQYFEAHGTGTQAGDTVEPRAIATIFASSDREPLLIGSVKTNIGHTEAASGLGSIIKTALAMEKGIIPPSINFEKPNPKIALEDWNLRLVRELEKWPAAAIRRASINNFGYGGANAHIIMEDGASWIPAFAGRNAYSNGHSNGHGIYRKHVQLDGHARISHDNSKVFVLSGKDEQACQRMISNLKDYLEQQKLTQPNPGELLESLAYTLGQRRTRFPWVAAHPVPVTEGIDTVIQALDSPKFKPIRSSRAPRIGMVFTGQGAQWYAMGRELVNAYPVYKESLEEAEGYLKDFGAEWSLMEELSRDAESSRINEVALSTPICVAVQISLVRLLRAWGVVPMAVTSHSSGEIAAAYTVGALSYQAAMAFSYYRAVLAADKRLRGPVKGGMVAVGLGLEDTESYLKRLTSGGQAVVACINSPSSITVAGDLSAVKELEDLAVADGVFARRLKVDVAWHSYHMAPIANVYVKALEELQSTDIDNALKTITFSSPVTGGRMIDAKEIASPEHWVQSLLQPVQFVDAFIDMIVGESGTSASNVDVVVEVGPHTALGGPIQEILALPEFKDLRIPYYGCLVRKTDARQSMQALAASLLQEGYPVDMEAVNFPHGREQHVKVLTELPSYPWNHQVKHWVEPRFNRALRERSHPPHDLLGSLVEGSNPETPSWRHILRISESPWTRDHVIQSNVVYPAAGYICLAIEAIRQLTTIDQKTGAKEISGYRLRDVDFLQALMIPDNAEGIEIQTTIRPVSEKDVSAQGWKHFEVWTVTADNRWTQHAKGLISIEFEFPSLEALKPTTRDFDIKGYTRRIIPADLFANLRALGIAHGPMFQNMKGIVQSGSEMRSMVTMTVADTTVPNDLPRDPVLHPVTLDSIITAPYSAVPGAAARETAAKVPRSVTNFWVSSKISHTAGYVFKTHSSLIRDDRQGMEADVSVVDPGDGNVVLEMKGFSYQSLGRSVSLQQSAPWETELCSKMDWSLDISFASPATFASIEKQLSCNIDPSEDSFRVDVWRVCVYFMQQALLALDPRDTECMGSHYAKYYAWMNDTVQRAASGQICIGSAEWLVDEEPEKQRRIDQVAKASVGGEMVCRLGAQLVPILRGQTAPLELMAEDNLLPKLYTETPKVKRMGSQLAGLLRHLAHKNPRARILEIGAGTGAMTRYALEALGTTTSGGPHASLYHYTDISAAFFEAARESLSAWSDLLSFDVLDIDQDPAAQGFTNGPYDIVIASRVLHTTKSISRTLNNVRSLLKPNGTLLLMEDVQCHIDAQFVSGLLPNWWLGEEPEREANPVLSAPMWDRYLRAAGFAVDLKLPDCESTESQTAITIMATVPMSLPPKLSVGPEKLVIVTSRRAGSPPSGWLQSLQDSIAACTEGEDRKLPVVQELESASATSTWFADKICIFIGEVDEPILYDLDSASLEGIRAMSTSCKGLIWVTRGGAVDCESPELSLAAGFVRSLRSEYVGRKLLTLDLDPKGPLWSDAGASAIVQILRTAFGNSEDGPGAEKGPTEFEYAERDGVILVPRLYHDVARDQMLSPNASDLDAKQTVVMEPFYQPDRPLCLQPESLAFGDDDKAYYDSLQPSLIEVEPRAYGTDLRHTDEHIIGLECAGIVTRVGSEAAAQGYVVGDRVVCLLSQSSFPSRATVGWRSTVRMPTELTFEEAASLPVAFLTAYFSLIAVARLQRTQSVLIHAAAGSVGQAAIMVAQHLGAEIFATVGSPEERELIMRRHGIPADHIFNSHDTSFGPATLAATNGYGVDVVLNSLAGPLLQESFNLVAPLGHFVEIGKHDSERNSNLEMRPFSRSVSFSAIDLPSLLERRGADVHRYLGEVMRLVEANAVAPVHPITAYSMGDIAEASRLLQTGHHMGKVVLSVGSHEMVPVLPRAVAAKLSPDASYLIVGGTGGLGQSVAHWMISRGARNLVLLSRSAAKSEKTAALAEELREAGCSRVLPVSCDVANEDDVARAIQVCAQEGLPPIRGVIHAAFVLHDSFVEKMTLDDYRYTTQSKVAGCWNLHNQFNLPGDLDFFVLFSSINGILGYASQAAYSAAGAYEDALAHWRVKHCGLPGVSIDLSVVNAVGYVAEANASETLRKSLLKAGRRVIDEDHVLASLESAILSPYDPQFVVGGINSGPGPHWELDGDLGRDMRVLPLRYRQPSAAAQEEQGQQNGSDPLAARMAVCASRDEAIRAVGSALAEMLADMFLVPVEDIDLSESPSQQGVDSLVAVEVRNMLFSQAGAELSIFNIMQSPSLAMLAADVVDRSKHVKFAAAS
ncbi:polyketide synthase [Aspergillus pseudoviridinutans]|uniref:Polyketide synthase n=1 Tax=Aspergillus pseudoviridinutans TaxID=1517512 RepID=A0A9P3EUM0_9EURO|nr:polyketide synthase [Aspergillus pseudoviridinutans]GIJ86782.1 polyketide synthase [Aspergillus pseudoviridinutans]